MEIRLSLQGPFREYDYHKKYKFFGDIYPTKYMRKATDMFGRMKIWLLQNLPFQAKTCTASRTSKIRDMDASFGHHGDF